MDKYVGKDLKSFDHLKLSPNNAQLNEYVRNQSINLFGNDAKKRKTALSPTSNFGQVTKSTNFSPDIRRKIKNQTLTSNRENRNASELNPGPKRRFLVDKNATMTSSIDTTVLKKARVNKFNFNLDDPT